MDIKKKLEREIERIDYSKINTINDNKIKEIINFLKQIDTDLRPMLKIIEKLMSECDDQKIKTLMIVKLLKFYGVGNDNVLTVRQKMHIVGKQLCKKPFLKENHKNCINILLEDLNIF